MTSRVIDAGALEYTEATKLRPPRKDELVADNSAFVELAGELLEAFRDTDDKACAICGANQGEQHQRRAPCFKLAVWRAQTQYKRAGA